MKKPKNTLKRALQRVPKEVKQLILREGLWDAYHSRPPYQRNDYIGWINRAKRNETKNKRTQQMLTELRQGDRYMKMIWRPR